MSDDKFNLTIFIKNSFKETIEYLKKNNIQIGGLLLRIIGSLEEYKQIYKTNAKSRLAWYDSGKREIYIIKSELEKDINKDVNNPNKIFIGNLFAVTSNGILYPIYKNDDDIEKLIAKAIVDPIVIHEIGHDIVGAGNWKATAFEYLVYFYKNELYKYPEVYKIIEENIKRCERFIREKDPNPSTLGACFANDLIYIHENLLNKDKQSPKLNIKDTIEKIKFIPDEDGMDITKILNTLLITKDYYIDINRMFNALTKVLMLLYP
jgi:hypothetical protein